VAKKKVFLDSNILFSLTYNENPFSKLQLLFSLQKIGIIDLYISQLVAKETFHNVNKKIKHKLSKFEKLLDKFIIVDDVMLFPQYIESIKLPYNDKLILNSAVENNCDYFITGNTKDFKNLYGQEIDSCLIITPKDFFEVH